MTLILGSALLLRPVVESDLTDSYVSWLNDPEVNAFLETRFQYQTLELVRDYWKAHGNDPSSPWWAICRRDQQDRHIGNIKLGPIHPIHKRADISLFIGDRKAWGLGLATEAISLVRDWAFMQLELHKLSAGIYGENIGSRRAFEKCGFVLEGSLRDEVQNVNGGWTDVLRFGLLKKDLVF